MEFHDLRLILEPTIWSQSYSLPSRLSTTPILFVSIFVSYLFQRRLGAVEGTEAILNHPYFDRVDIEGITQGSLEPSYVPRPLPEYLMNSNSLSSLCSKKYRGDQRLFEGF